MKILLKLFLVLVGNIFFSQLYAQKPTMDLRIIVAGVVFDSETLLPVQNVNVYDGKGEYMAKSDEKGYFIGQMLGTKSNNSVAFKMKLEKKGYLTFTQTENWADNQKKEINVNYYFGIKKAGKLSDAESSSHYLLNENNSFESVSKNFENVLKKLNLEIAIKNLRKNNQSSFFEFNNTYYLVSDTGWIKLDSSKALINVNSRKITAEEINSSLKRSEIRDILHTESGEIKLVTYKNGK